MANNLAPPSLHVISMVYGKTYTIGQVYQTAEGGEVIIDRFGVTRILAPLAITRKRPNNSTDITEEEVAGKFSNDVTTSSIWHPCYSGSTHSLNHLAAALWVRNSAKPLG